jgi:hypothetical protein
MAQAIKPLHMKIPHCSQPRHYYILARIKKGPPMDSVITIDTCIFENFGLNTDEMLKKMKPIMLKPGMKFILSEIVMLELQSHYETAFKAVSRSLDNFTKNVSRFSTNPKNSALIEELTAQLRAEKTKNTGLQNFIDATKSEIVPYENISLKYVMNAYFKTEAPFRTGKKKYEFPDAIAIYSLDKWAIANNRKLLAISCDNDWAAFAERNPKRWECVKSIEDAAKHIR